jgi:hypothetical protein
VLHMAGVPRISCGSPRYELPFNSRNKQDIRTKVHAGTCEARRLACKPSWPAMVQDWVAELTVRCLRARVGAAEE